VLVAEHLGVRYGAAPAVRDVSLSLAPGEVVAILGPNGAGKTSTLRAISGLVAHAGAVTVDGHPVTSAHQARAAGVVHVPQGRGLFRQLTVAQNLALGAYLDRGGREAAVAGARRRIPELDRWLGRRVASLSGGEQVLVALGRLLAARPRYALVDELTLGLAPITCDRVDAELARLRDDGVALIVVDQHPGRALGLAERAVVLERGVAVATGTPDELGDGEDLVRRYLGARA
jgi:branched-chain amino acid transport system ATP-binding protein